VRRLTHGELLSAASALLLTIAMFGLEWFGVDGIPGRTPSLAGAENAWHGLTLVRWVMLLTVAAALGSPLLHASQRSHGAATNTSLGVAALGTLTAALLVYRVLIDLPSSDQVVDQKLGAFIGVMCALGIALGGYESMREDRSRRARVGKGSLSPVRSLDGRPDTRYRVRFRRPSTQEEGDAASRTYRPSTRDL
jgi:hypothetical protein